MEGDREKVWWKMWVLRWDRTTMKWHEVMMWGQKKGHGSGWDGDHLPRRR
jgi:hypothetical protein